MLYRYVTVIIVCKSFTLQTNITDYTFPFFINIIFSHYFSDDDNDITDVHQLLLKKPEREQITWATHYLEPEKEDEKTLVKKADDLTDRVLLTFSLYKSH